MSPVIGMVLVLAISVLGIVAVTNWGFPAIQELNARVELRAVQDEFRDLDATLQQMISGTAGQTTFKWQPTISKGAIDVSQTGLRWLAAADHTWTGVRWTNVSDTDSMFTIRTNASLADLKVKAWSWDGGAATELRVNATSSCGAAPPTTLAANTNLSLFLGTNTSSCSAVNLENAVVSFAIYEAGAVLHRAYLVDVGHVHWLGTEGRGAPNHVYSVNGGVLSGPADRLVVQSPLAVPPPRDFTNATGAESTSLFLRFLKFNGTASFSGAAGGQERYAIYLNLVGTYSLGTTDNATATSVYAWGDQGLRDGVYDALANPHAGYAFTRTTDAALGEEMLVHTEGGRAFRVTAVYSLVAVQA